MYGLDKISGYTVTHGSSNEYCGVCRFRRKDSLWCKILMKYIVKAGWCRFFRVR